MIALINTTRENRVSIVPACTKSIPHTSLSDDNSTCITRKYGETIEAAHQKNDKDPLTIALSYMETCTSNAPIVRT